jgi:hypothetical protein
MKEIFSRQTNPTENTTPIQNLTVQVKVFLLFFKKTTHHAMIFPSFFMLIGIATPWKSYLPKKNSNIN